MIFVSHFLSKHFLLSCLFDLDFVYEMIHVGSTWSKKMKIKSAHHTHHSIAKTLRNKDPLLVLHGALKIFEKWAVK